MLTLTGFAAFAAAPASAQQGFSFTRLAGSDRFGTAADIATNTFPTGADIAILANGDTGHFPDALAGNYLAGADKAPILLTHVDTLPTATSDAMTVLKTKKVVILGGTQAVSAAVQAQLASKFGAANVTRIGGLTRYDTAKLIAETPPAAGIGSAEGKGATAIVASGENFPDALTAGPLGYAKSFPVEITDTTSLSPETKQALQDLGIKYVLIAGGTAAVSANVESQIQALGITTKRLAGNTRQLTAVAIADYALANLGFSNAHVNLARGDAFPDALAGGPHAGAEVSPILLTDSNCSLGAAAEAYLKAHSNTLKSGHVFGGTAAVCDAVVAQATTDATGTTAPSQTTRPELTSAAIVNTVLATQATPGNPVGTRVRYFFDEPVANFPPTAGQFHVYNADGTLADSGATATAESTGNSVLVNFATVATTAAAGKLTLATVDSGAVTDNQGTTNTIGDAAVGSSQQNTSGAAGVTAAPDLVSVGGFRPGNQTGLTAVDFTFDEKATTAAPNFFNLVLVDGSVINCTAPAVGSTTPGHGTVPGGNGTTTITVTCPNPGGTVPTTQGTPLSTGNTSRGYVGQGSVNDTDTVLPAVPNTNPLEAADVGNGGNTVDPDLVSATFTQGTGANNDTAVYKFDEQVATPLAANAGFQVYSTDATQADGGTVTAISTDKTQVLVDFGNQTALDNAVGAIVEPATVTAVDNGNNNEADEVGVANQSTSTITPGQTAAPDLTGVALSDTGTFGGFQAAYTFDADVDLVNPGNFVLYLADGTTLTASTCAVGATESTDNVVTCSAYGAATSAQIGSATLGAADNDAVDVQGASVLANPEGAEATTGGTGTSAS